MLTKKKLWKFVIALTFIGALASAYLIKVKYTGSGFCEINAKFSCDVVNSSKYSEILGIPVALLGVIAYLFMGLSAYFNLTVRNFKNKWMAKLFSFEVLLYFALISLTFTLYLSGIEFFVLKAYCILCLTSQVAMLGIVGSLVYMKKRWK